MLTRSLLLLIWMLLGVRGLDAQLAASIETRKVDAYKHFHDGKILQARKQLESIAAILNDPVQRTVTQRDLLEVCAAGFYWDCVADTIQQMLPTLKAEPNLRVVYPDIILYEAKRAQWMGNNGYFAQMVENNGLTKIANPSPQASLFSELALVVHSYHLQKGDARAAEELRSSAFLGLLLTDPTNTYAICKALIDLIEAQLEAREVAGAIALAITVDTFISKSINQKSVLYARYRMLLGQLLTFTNAHPMTVANLVEAAKLFEQLEIPDEIKTHRIATAYALASAALALEGKQDAARELHSRHPLQARRQDILKHYRFQTSTDFFFAVTDVFMSLVVNERPDERWAPLFEKDPEWNLSQLQRTTIDSYRNFARGLLLLQGSTEKAHDLLILAANQRLAIFNKMQDGSSEIFSISDVVDKIIITAGLASAVKRGGEKSVGLMIAGGEVLGRNIRHQLVDVILPH